MTDATDATDVTDGNDTDGNGDTIMPVSSFELPMLSAVTLDTTDAPEPSPATMEISAVAGTAAGRASRTNGLRRLSQGGYGDGRGEDAVSDDEPAPPQIPLAPFKRMQARFNPLADGMVYLVVFVGGFFGTAMRYGLSLVMPTTLGAGDFLNAFHLPTFVANMLACFIFATLSTYMSQASWIRKRVRQLTSRGVGMGMCGGFSTLSAMTIEDLTSLRAGQMGGFAFYTLTSFLGGLIVAWLGTRLALALAARRSARVLHESLLHPEPTVAPSRPPSGDYGQPLQEGVLQPIEPGQAVLADPSATTLVPSFEPDPVTDEIPMVADPIRGEARER